MYNQDNPDIKYTLG